MAHGAMEVTDQCLNRTDAIYRIAGHDRAALKVLYDDISPKLFALLIRMTNDHGLSEKLLQEVFVTIWKTADQFALAPIDPNAWLFRITLRAAIGNDNTKRG